jgi:hypothetical protein
MMGFPKEKFCGPAPGSPAHCCRYKTFTTHSTKAGIRKQEHMKIKTRITKRIKFFISYFSIFLFFFFGKCF